MPLKSGPVVRAPGGIFSPSTLTRSLTPHSAWEWETVLLPTVLNELLVFSTTQAHISSGRQGWKPVNYISQNPVNYISQNPLSAGIPFIFHNDTLIWDLEERGDTDHMFPPAVVGSHIGLGRCGVLQPPLVFPLWITCLHVMGSSSSQSSRISSGFLW